MKTMCFILCFSILLGSCNKLFKDEELSLKRVSYIGEELKMDGYYYEQGDKGTTLFFLYRNGIRLQCYYHSTKDFSVIESELRSQSYLEQVNKDKTRWGLFVVKGTQFIYEGWSTSVGGGLPMYRSEGIIENDTTLLIVRSLNSEDKFIDVNWDYHFRKFSPKPDSMNNFIK